MNICLFPNAAGVDFMEVTDDQVNVDFSPFPYIYNLLDGGSGDFQMSKTFTLVLSVGREAPARIDPASDTATITIECKLVAMESRIISRGPRIHSIRTYNAHLLNTISTFHCLETPPTHTPRESAPWLFFPLCWALNSGLEKWFSFEDVLMIVA